MRKKFVSAIAAFLMLLNCLTISTGATGSSYKNPPLNRPVIADHSAARIELIPADWAKKARDGLHIAYGHSSHGSQITYGMMGLSYFKGEPFICEKGSPKGSIDIRDNPFGGEKDLGNPDNKTWAEETRKYLEKNSDINVVIWSWCGQLSEADSAYVKNYLDLMQGLESRFPEVTFVYMTGHLDGTGLDGKLARANRQIREFCISNNKVLFDFADIESYDPDGRYFGDKLANDKCEYDSNGDGDQDRNWAKEWQNNHREDKDWYSCYAAHTEPVNANMKAYAMWWLLARVTGWDGGSGAASGKEPEGYEYYATKLQDLGLLRGDGQGFDLGRVPTRLEGAVMLTRLLGGENEAMSKKYQHPFKDALSSWGNQYVGYLYRSSLTKGISEDSFGCDFKLGAENYVTFLLRVLGYSESTGNGDFQWDKSLEKARDLGMIDAGYYALLKKEGFHRGHMAKLTFLSLTQKMKGGSMTLLEKLVKDNVISKKAAERF